MNNPNSLDHFIERLRSVNPFLANRVDRPLAAKVIDVPDIHGAEFQKVLALGQQAHDEDRGLGVLVWGEAGVGKSHLLARLAQWSREGRRACFLYLHNLQAGPERLPRYVLRCVLSMLSNALAPPLSHSPLFALLNAVLRKALQAEGLTRPSWPQLYTAYGKLLGRLAARDPSHGVLFDRTIYHVLYRFYEAAHPNKEGKADHVARLALRWLSGDPLDAEESRQLGLRPDEPAGLADNQHVKQVLVTLTRLARIAGQLFLLCFDQVDNLDEEQVHALSRFLHDVLDSAGNLLVVTTGVQQTLLGFQQSGVITETSWDRLSQVPILLKRISGPRGQELLQARLQPFLKPFLAVPELAAQVEQDALFPLGSGWFEQRVGRLADYRPRDLLTWAGERWLGQQERLNTLSADEWLERWREGATPPVPPRPPTPAEVTAAVDRAVSQKLAEEINRRVRNPAELPPSEEQLQGLTFKLLRRLGGGLRVEAIPQARHGGRQAYDLRVIHLPAAGAEPIRLGVRFLVAEHGNTATAALKRLDDDPAPPDRLLLVTDARRPLPLGPEGRRRLDSLHQRGPAFLHVELTFEDYALLDSLQAVADAARAGDLEAELPFGQLQRVSEAEVIDSHRRHGRYREHPLLRELLGDEAPPAAPGPDPLAAVSEQALREFLVSQAALAEGMSLPEAANLFASRLSTDGRPGVDGSRCLPRLRQVAAQMVKDGKLVLTPEEMLHRLPR
jgi:hypothetical protein